MNNQEKMIRWLLDTIDTEVAKPEGEADMALVDECTALLGELTGGTNTIPARELKKRCRAITRGGKSCSRKKVRLIAAVAACLAVFVVMSGCGYLPSINVILQTIFASGVGKDVEVHEVTYTFEGMITQYDDINQLITSEKLDILIPTVLPNDNYIINILVDGENIFILLNKPDLTFQIFINKKFNEFVHTSDYEVYDGVNGVIYTRKISNGSYIAYYEYANNVYCIQHNDLEAIIQTIESLR